MLFAHIDSRGLRLHSKIPFPLNIIGSKYEYVLMRTLGRMTDAEWIYRHNLSRGFVDWLANKVVIPLIHGEVMTPEELRHLVHLLEEEGHTLALGMCECRHGEGNWEDGLVDGTDPNRTCVMIGDWGKGHLYSYPHDYRQASAEELADLARFWHERGRILTGWGARTVHGFLGSYCHCMPQYCVPLRNQLKRGNQVFYHGYNYAVVDPELCDGPDNCAFNCASRCFFGAIREKDGKAFVDIEKCFGCGQCFLYCPTGAAKSVKREGYEMPFCAPDLLGYA
jgi:NAD-dependent dihydropyrimidine dehydrogenase PreA subunit